ncbi:hypothetical protein [Tomitella biformata]|uniref:hypothetical protein n=1 Tax=Tomitella biformata TaxID=630403 RepID=UPI000463DC7A|nr:hypothetical protein [Tomitella biformata]
MSETRPAADLSFPILDRCASVLLRPDGTVQLGVDPHRAVVITPPAEVTAEQTVRLLGHLDGSQSLDEACMRSAVAKESVLPILEELGRSGFLSARRPEPVRRSPVRVHGRGPLTDHLRSHLLDLGFTVLHTSANTPSGDESRWQTGLVLLTDRIVPEPGMLRELHSRAIPHLSVRLRDGVGVLGPLVLPGTTSCLRCADLYRRDLDPDWPLLLAQQLGRTGNACRATLLATVGLAMTELARILTPGSNSPHLAQGQPVTLNTTIEVDLRTPSLATRHWPRHPLCRCWSPTSSGPAHPGFQAVASQVGANREQ